MASEQLAEYNAILDSTAKLSDRRQTINDVFVGLNSLFLTAVGFFFVSSKLNGWWTTAIFGVVAIFTTVVNSIWLRLNNRYRNLVGIRISYLTALEEVLGSKGALQTLTVKYHDIKGGDKVAEVVGVHHLENQTYLYKGGANVGFSSLERALIWVFMLTYYALTLIVGILTYLIINNIVPPLILHP